MTHHATTRPISGKLMASAAPSPGRAAPFPPGDVVDAEFETVEAVETAPAGPPCGNGGNPARRPGLEMLAGEKPRPARVRQPGGRLFWSVGACLVFAAFWMSGGHAALLGDSTPPQAVAGPALTLSGVSSRVDHSGARPVILVDGHAGNDGAQPVEMPGLEIRVADLEGRIIRYKLGTAARRLQPGEQFAFSSRLDVPKSGVKTVSVTFAR